MIGIIDYGMGNLRSVQKAFESFGARAVLLREAEALADVDRLVLPGVGAFEDGMDNLRSRGFIEAIRAFVATGRPFLGICLGMQLLFDGSQENAPSGSLVAGLGLLPGTVERFTTTAPQRLKVPHVYFVHSYYCRPGRAQDIAAVCEYGGDFCAAVSRDNIDATQFHPEKSQRVGLRILANFAAN
jgi:glutamine amidotransferase